MDRERIILKYALRNAAKFGKAEPSRLIGKIIGEEPALKDEIKRLMPAIKQIVDEVNLLSPQEIESRLEEFPEEKKEQEKDLFSFVHVPPGKKVVTAFPPDPSKYPTIGHVKAALMNFLFAKKHAGQFYLRFEDTNPELPKTEFYEQFLQDLVWVGIIPDQVFYASDHIDYLYGVVQKFLDEGHAYVCICTQERVSVGREKGTACPCRDLSPQENRERFAKMLDATYHEGEATVRLNIDLAHQNSTMRDPTVFRIIEHPHPRKRNAYRVWPNYDFQNAILDGYTGVTHRFRSKEFELRNELQGLIQSWAGFPRTEIFEFGRLNLEGVPSSGRVIREMMQKGEILGWDDPKLQTVVALRRRGFTPQGITNFLVSTGMTKNESVLTWDDLIMNNKRIIDSVAKRYFFVWDPKELSVRGIKKKTVYLRDHPEHEEKTRRIDIDGHFLVTVHDHHALHALPEGAMVRLMDCINLLKGKDGFDYHSDDYPTYKNHPGEKAIIHWLPAVGNVQVDVFMPDHEHKKGYGEQSLDRIQVGDVIQFERFGFSRLDKKASAYHFWYTHK